MISPFHTWQAWIKPVSQNKGTLFEHQSKTDLKISSFENRMTLEIDGNSTEMECLVVNDWNVIGMKIWYLKN